MSDPRGEELADRSIVCKADVRLPGNFTFTGVEDRQDGLSQASPPH
jgi:hypothetical protein